MYLTEVKILHGLTSQSVIGKSFTKFIEYDQPYGLGVFLKNNSKFFFSILSEPIIRYRCGKYYH